MVNILRKIFLTSINRIGRAIPKKFQRLVADYPGLLNLFEKLSKNELIEVLTSEEDCLVINPLFHSSLIQSGKLDGYEPEIRQAILKFTKPGMVAYDIGANVGVFSFLFASIVGDNGIVYSFEPEENNYTCFRKSLEKNGKKNIILDKRAVGKTRGLEIFDRRGGAFSGRLVGKGLYEITGNVRNVETINIDHVVENEGYRVPDILKIDVEGNEGMVIEGMKNILEKHSPILICELHSHLGESTDSVTGLLSSYGYAVFDIKDALSENNLNKTTKFSIESHIVAIKKQYVIS